MVLGVGNWCNEPWKKEPPLPSLKHTPHTETQHSETHFKYSKSIIASMTQNSCSCLRYFKTLMCLLVADWDSKKRRETGLGGGRGTELDPFIFLLWPKYRVHRSSFKSPSSLRFPAISCRVSCRGQQITVLIISHSPPAAVSWFSGHFTKRSHALRHLSADKRYPPKKYPRRRVEQF